MPTTFVFREHFDGRPASASTRNGRKLVRRWEGVSSALVDGVAVIEALTAQEGVYFGSSHPSWLPCTCRDIKADPDGDDYYTWIVQADYDQPAAMPGFVPGMPNGGTVGGQPGAGGTGTPYQPPAPVDRPTYFSLDFRKEPRYFREDLDGADLVNTAVDPLEDVPPQYVPFGVIKAKKFYSSWSVALGLAVIGRVNQDTWLGFLPDTCMIESCPAAPKTKGSWSYWEVDYSITYDPSGWNPTRLLNVGRRTSQIITPALPALPYREWAVITPDKHGGGAPTLHFLDNTGKAVLAPGLPPLKLPFRFHQRINFNGLIDP